MIIMIITTKSTSTILRVAGEEETTATPLLVMPVDEKAVDWNLTHGYGFAANADRVGGLCQP
jgi:hypothetical protein